MSHPRFKENSAWKGMETYLLALAFIFATHPENVSAEPQATPFSVTLVPKAAAYFNDLAMICEAKEVEVTVDQPASPIGTVLVGRGSLAAAFADCTMPNGRMVRVKAGASGSSWPFGACGEAPPRFLSIWVDHRKLVSRRFYEGHCSEAVVRSIKVTDAGVEICDRSESVASQTAGPGAGRSVCKTFKVSPAMAEDQAEFPRGTVTRGAVDSLVVARPTDGSDAARPVGASFCRSLIDPGDPTRVRLPTDATVPAWVEEKMAGTPPNVSTRGYNATTFSETKNFELRNTLTARADFDLENDGRVTTVYRHEEGRQWFHGSAFARERQDILTTPFDVENWPRSVASGIYPFGSAYGTVFFVAEKTYILLDPASPTEDPKVVMLHDRTVETVCRFHRRLENF